MDADCEGVVAIVQGMQDAGLTVTVADARQLQRGIATACSANSQGPLEAPQSPLQGPKKVCSSVQTCGPPSYTQHNVVSPNLYPYQIAPHSAASMQHQVAETPNLYTVPGQTSLYNPRPTTFTVNPVTVSPTRASTASDLFGSMRPVRDQPHRSSRVWDHTGARSRGTDAFAESLRKYPQCTERCTSADLIHRLLTYTQTKNFTKSSYHSKSLRSLRKQAQESPKDNVPAKKSSKNIQTYTRNRQESPTSSYHDQLSSIYGKPERRRRASPARSDTRSSPTRQRADPLSTSYDYLKIGAPKFSARSTDVRYLNDVTRYVKDTLRMIYDDQSQPQMCPRIASRYSQHRREHHHAEAGTTTSAEKELQTQGKNEKVQTMPHKRVASLSPCNAPGPSVPQTPSRVRDMFKNNVLRRICRICQQPLPCECPDSSPPSPREMKRLKSLDLAKELLCRMCPSDDEDDDCICLEKIRIIVDEWLKEVPIYANFTRQEKADREEIVNNLRGRIRLYIDDEENCKKEIKNCLNKLPMWLPSEEGDRQQFKQSLTAKLWHMLRSGRDRDRIEEIVREWLTTVTFKIRPPVDKNRLAYELTYKLSNVFAVTKLGELKGALKECVLDEINRLPILCDCSDRDSYLPELADKLVDSLLFEKINDDVRTWINNIPFKPTPPIDKEKLILDMTRLFKDIIETADPDMVREVLGKAVLEELRKLPVDCDEAEKDTYYPILVDQLLHSFTRDKLSQSVRDWIDTVPFKSRSRIDKEKLAVDLTKKLRDIVEMTGTVELKDTLKKALVEELMNLPVDCDPSEQSVYFPDLAEPLANSIANDEMGYVIRKWIKHIPFVTPVPVNKKKLAADLIKKIKEVAAETDPEVLREALGQTLFDEVSKWPIDMDPSELDEYVPEIINKLLDDLTKDKFSQTVRNWVNGIPFKPEVQVEKYLLAADLTKKLKDVVAVVHPDTIRDAFKDVVLSELEEYPVDCDSAESEDYFSALADNLIDDLAVDRIGQTVRNWTKAIPFKASPPVDKVKLAVNLSKKLRNITASTGPADLKETLKQVITEELTRLPIDCDSSEKESYITEIAENLADTLADDEINSAVSKWVNRLPFDPTLPVDGDELISNLANKLKGIVAETDPGALRSVLENAIMEELQTLPLDCDPIFLPALAEELVDAIMKDKLGETVRDWVESIPLLLDPPVDKDQLASEITKKLRDIIMISGPQELKTALKDALLTELEKLPLDCEPAEKEELLSTLADKLAEDITNDKISKCIQNWIQKIPFKSTPSVDKKKIQEDLTNKFKDILSMVDPSEVRDALKGAALEELLGLPVDYDPSVKDKYLPQLADKLADDLTKDKFGHAVRNWANNVPFDPLSPTDKKEFTNNLVQQLRSTYAKSESNERKPNLKQVILDNLANVALQCDAAKTESLAEKLADKLVSLPKQSSGIDLTNLSEEEAQMLELLKQRPEFAKMTDEEIKEALKEMGTTYKELEAQGLSSNEIERRMQCLPVLTGLPDLNNLTKEEAQLLDVLKQRPEFAKMTDGEIKAALKEMGAAKKDLQAQGLSPDEIERRMQTLPVLAGLPDLNNLTEEEAQLLDMLKQRPEFAKMTDEEIKKSLKEMVATNRDLEAQGLSPEEIERKMKSIPLLASLPDLNNLTKEEAEMLEILKQRPEFAKMTDEEIKQSLKEMISTNRDLEAQGLSPAEIERKLKNLPIPSGLPDLNNLTKEEAQMLEMLKNRPEFAKMTDEEIKQSLKEMVLTNRDLEAQGLSPAEIERNLKNLPIPSGLPDLNNLTKEEAEMLEMLKKRPEFVKMTDEEIKRSLKEMVATSRDLEAQGLSKSEIERKMKSLPLLSGLPDLKNLTKEEAKMLEMLKKRPEFAQMTDEEIKKSLKEMVATSRDLEAQGLSKNEIERKMKSLPLLAGLPDLKNLTKEEAEMLEILKKRPEFAQMTDEEIKKSLKEMVATSRDLEAQGLSKNEIEKKMKSLPLATGSIDLNNLTEKEAQMMELLKQRPEFAKMTDNDIKKALKEMVATNRDLEAQGLNPDEIKIKMQESAKLCASEFKKGNPKLFAVNLSDMLKDIGPTLSQKESEKLVKEVVGKLRELREGGTEESLVHDLIKKHIEEGLRKIFQERGEKPLQETVKSLAKNFYTQLFNTSDSDTPKKMQLAQALKTDVQSWLQDNPELEKVRKNKKIAQNIADRLANIQVTGIDDRLIKENMLKEIKNILKNEDKSLASKVAEKLAEKLYDKVKGPISAMGGYTVASTSTSSPFEKSKKKKRISSTYPTTSATPTTTATSASASSVERTTEPSAKQVKDWVENIPALASKMPAEKKVIENIMKDLAGNLMKLNTQNLGDESRQNMLNQIKGSLDADLEKKGIKMNSKEKLALANVLLDKLQGGVRKQSSTVSFTMEPEDDVSDAIRGTIEDWIESNPALKAGTTAEKKKSKKYIRNLGKRLSHLYKERNDDPQVKNKMLIEINSTLDSILESKGEDLEPDIKKNMADMLLTNVLGTSEEIESKLLTPQVTATTKTKQGELNGSQKTAAKTKEIKEKMLGEIQDKFSTAIKTRQEYIDLKAKNQLAGQLVDNVFELEKLDNRLKSNIKALLQELPEVFTGSPADMQHLEEISTCLANDLKDIQPDLLGDDPESKKQVLKRIKETLITAFEKKGGLDSKTAKMLSEKIFDNTTDLLKKIAHETELLQTLQKDKDSAGVSTAYRVSAGSKELDSKPKDSADIMETLAEKVFAWTENIPQLKSMNPYEKEQNSKISKALGKELAELLTKDPNDPKIQEQMMGKIKNALHSALDERGEKLDPKTKKQLAEKLFYQVIEAYKSPAEKKDLIEKAIIDWYGHMPELTSGSSSERGHIEKISRKLAKKVRDLQALGKSKKELKARVKVTVGDHLKSVFHDKGQYLDNSTKNKLVDKLLHKLADIIVASDMNEPSKVVQKTISEWIDLVPELAEKFFHTSQGDLFSYELVQSVTEFLSNGMDDKEVRWQVFKEIKRRLDIMLRDNGANLDYKTKHQLAEHFFDNILESVKKNKRIKRKLQSAIELDVKKWIKDMSTLYTNGLIEEETLKDNVFDKNNNLQSKGIDKKAVRDEIFDDILGQASSSFNEHDKFLNIKSVEITVGDSLQINRGVHSANITGNKNDLLQVFQRDVMAWLQEIPETAITTATERKAIDKITHALARKLAALHSKGVNNKEVHQEMVEEIKDHLDDILDKKGEHITNKNKRKFAEKLMIQLMPTAPPPSTTAQPASTVRHHKETQKITNVQVDLKKSQDKDLQRSLLWEWFNNIPLLSSGHRCENLRMIDKLNNKLLFIQNMNVDDEAKRERIETEISNWLDDACDVKSQKLDRKIKHKFIWNLANSIRKCQSKNLMSSIENATLSNRLYWKMYPDTSKKVSNYEEDSSSDKYYVDKNKTPNKSKPVPQKSAIKEFRPVIIGSGSEVDDNPKAFGIKKPRSGKQRILGNHSGSEVDDNSKSSHRTKPRSSIQRILGNHSGSEFDDKPKTYDRTKPRSSKQRTSSPQFANSSGKASSSQFARAKSPTVKRRPLKTSATDFRFGVRQPSAHFTEKKPEVYYLGETSDIDVKGRSKSNLAMVKSMSVKELSKEIDPEIQEKITSIIRMNIDKMNTPESDEVRQEILTILLDEVGLPSSEAEGLVDSIIRRAEIKAIDAGNAELQLLAFIRDEITEFIAEFEIKKERQVELEAYLVELVHEKLLKGSLDAETRREALAAIAAKGLMSNEQAEEILDRLVGETKSMMSSPAISKSVSRIESGNRTNRSSLTLKEQTTFEKKARRIITNFIYDHIKQASEKQKETIKKVVEDAIVNLEDILTDTDLDGLEKRRQMVKECERQLGKLTLDSNKPLPDLAEELMDRLESINLKTSTPKRSAMNSVTVFDSTTSSSPHPGSDSDAGLSSHLKDKARRPSQLKDNYSKKIEQVIGNWLNELPLDPDTLKDKQFKDTMIKDLAGSVADREQFLQLNPESKTTDAEELEHLKYQCNRWLNKFMEGDDLDIANGGVDRLIAAIRGVAVPDMASKKQSKTYEDALKDEIIKWVDTLPPGTEPTVDRRKMEQLAETLARRIKKHKGLPDAEEKIRNEIAEIVPSMFENVDEDELSRLESSLFQALERKGFTDDTWVGPQGVSGEALSGARGSGARGSNARASGARRSSVLASGEQILNTLLHDWLKQLPSYQTASPEEKQEQEAAASAMAKELVKILDKTKSAPDQDQMLKDEIMKHLPNIITDTELQDPDFLNKTADQLIVFLKGQKIFQDVMRRLRGSSIDLLAAAVDNWANSLPIDTETQQEKKQLEDAKKDLVSRLKRIRQQYPASSKEHDPSVKDELIKFMKVNITDPDKKSDEEYLEEKANEFMNILKSIPRQSADAGKPENYKSNKSLKNPADLLYRYIEEWCADLPVEGETDKVQSIKQNLASKLINKIGELNMDPDIFNDDILYEDLLHDEVDRLLEEVPRNPELDKYLPALKKDLISKIMEARHILRAELAGKAYKQQLRDAVSISMHLPKSLPPDEKASLELLKDKVADAFVNLNYSTDNEDQKIKYKKKISDEIDKFCDEIIHNYPCAHLDSTKIKRDLFGALIRIPVPKDDSMKSEVEQTRMKDIINDWMKELPLRQESPSEKLHRYKLATILSKRLHDIELEKEIDPSVDCDHKMSEDVAKFLGKLPIRYDQEDKIPNLIQKLLNKLKNSEQSRKFISARRSKSIETQSDVCNQYPCTLNQRDREHLMRIRERSDRRCYKDASVSPVIADSGCQTDSRDPCWPQPRPCVIIKQQPVREKPCYLKDASCMVRLPSPCHYPPVPSPCPMPNVIIKEYTWDSTDMSKLPQVSKATETRMSQSSQPRGSQSGALGETAESSKRLSTVQTEEFQQREVQSSPSVPVQSSQQECQTAPPAQTSRPCWCRPQQLEKEMPRQNTSPCAPDYVTTEPTSGDEAAAATSKTFWRQSGAESMESFPPCRKDCKYTRPRKSKTPAEDQESDWPDDFFDTCWRHRGRKADAPHTKRRERMQEKMKCKCKERILVSCRGPNNRNRYHDMCQACGSSCPHPSFMYFKR